jgi:hypothetical protein
VNLIINEFPDVTQIYTGIEVENFIFRIIPREDNIYVKGIMKTANVTEYDVWELLKALGCFNPQEDVYLHEILPEGTIVYERLDSSEV